MSSPFYKPKGPKGPAQRTEIHAPTRLNHENLDVYRAALEFLDFSRALDEQRRSSVLQQKPRARPPRGQRIVTEQLWRAAVSIPLNIAEGYGRRGKKDRARFYDIARGSAHECGALLDASIVLHLAEEQALSRGRILLYRIVCMLVKMSA